MKEKVFILDFGSAYTQLIARRVRALNIYCEVYPYHKFPEITDEVKAVILSGSSFVWDDKNAPHLDVSIFRGKVPLLGIGFGAQLIVHAVGGGVFSESLEEYKKSEFDFVDSQNALFKNTDADASFLMSEGNGISSLPSNFKSIASFKEGGIAGFQIEGEQTYGVQFHPEVNFNQEEHKILHNFLISIAACNQTWTPEYFVEHKVQELKEMLGNDRVILGLSGGVDSSVAAVLLDRAIGKNLYCIFVNHGLLRKNEYKEVLESYRGMGLNVKGVDASADFLDALKGITDPEEKRKTIGKIFVQVFDKEARLVENAKWLGQGTIYPDIIESIGLDGKSQPIKSHHNVGGLPDYMKLKVVEPLKLLFKDEVRRVGKALSIPAAIVGRHPFPGPGLGIRILGEVTRKKIEILQEADAIFIQELKDNNLYDKVWQAGVIFLPVNTVGVSGDKRTYENAVALRAVMSVDGMTANWVHLPYELLGNVSNKIINRVKGINRVTYDISSKPPATIEWE